MRCKCHDEGCIWASGSSWPKIGTRRMGMDGMWILMSTGGSSGLYWSWERYGMSKNGRARALQERKEHKLTTWDQWIYPQINEGGWNQNQGCVSRVFGATRCLDSDHSLMSLLEPQVVEMDLEKQESLKGIVQRRGLCAHHMRVRRWKGSTVQWETVFSDW